MIDNFNYYIFNLFMAFIYFPFFLISLGRCAKNTNIENERVRKLVNVFIFLFIMIGVLAIIVLILSFLLGWIMICSGGDFDVMNKYFCY